MKHFIVTFLFLSSCLISKAQQLPCENIISQDGAFQERSQQQRPNQDEIESRKIAYLATVVALTPVEAARFWPVYNEWNKKLDANLRKRHTALRQIRQLSGAESTDEKAYAQQNKILIDGAAEEARIVADAHQAYVSILGAARTAKLYLAEDQFRGMLIRELRQPASRDTK